MEAVAAYAAAVDADGYAVISDAIDPELTARLRGEAERMYQQHRHENPDAPFLHRFGFLADYPVFLPAIRSDVVLGAVCMLLCADVYVYHCHLNVDRGTTSANSSYDWHRDGGRIDVDLGADRPRLTVKVAVALSDMTVPGSGQTLVVPGSHRRAERPQIDRAQDGAVPVLMTAGSVLIFDRRLWHSRGPNLTGRTRHTMFCGFAYRWIRSRDDVVPTAATLAALDSIDRQLLGWAPSNRSIHAPEEPDTPLAEWWRAAQEARSVTTTHLQAISPESTIGVRGELQ